MGFWNVLAAGAAAWLFGVIWFRALSGPRAVAGGRGRPVDSSRPGPAIVSAFVMVLVAGFLRHIFYVSGLTANLPLGLIAGLGIGLFFIAPWLWMTNLADERPFRLVLIDGGFATLATAIMGALLVAF